MRHGIKKAVEVEEDEKEEEEKEERSKAERGEMNETENLRSNGRR